MTDRLRIGIWLGLGFGLLLGLVAGVAGASYWGAKSSPRTTPATLQQGDAKYAEHFARARANALQLRRYAKDMLLKINSPEKVSEYRKKWDEQRSLQEAVLDDLEKYAARKGDTELLKTMRKELADSDAAFTKFLGLIQDGKIKTPQDVNKAIETLERSKQS